jgi:antagonist of KipI
VELLKVLKPGLSTTVQDQGRRGCLEFGIPAGGAADMYSYRLVNAVLGNEASAAALELMLLGGTFEVLKPAEIAVAGADMRLQINGEDAGMGRRLHVKKGDVISLGKARAGCFGYLAVAGGFDGTVALGSRSTYVPGRLGGHFGRAVQKDDVLSQLEEANGATSSDAPVDVVAWPWQHEVVRFVRGPQAEYFSESGYRTFTTESYTISPRSNRMAYRLTGQSPELESIPRTSDTGSGPTDIIEDGNAVGAIQIAGGTEPICMGRDCPSTGAYAKIGCVITPDVSRMFQMQPGDTFRFQEVSLSEAFDVSRAMSAVVRGFGEW